MYLLMLAVKLPCSEYPTRNGIDFLGCLRLIRFVHEDAVSVFPVVSIHQAEMLEQRLSE
jgi:hypothetical protein